MNPTPELLARPVQVLHAVRLLYVSLGIGLLQICIKAPVMTSLHGSDRLMFLVPLVTLIVILFFMLIGQGTNWAHMLLLISYSLEVLALPGRMTDSFQVSVLSGALCAIQAGLQLWALILLFQNASSAWFHQQPCKESKAREPG